jgi:hypothetical protein
LQSPALAAVRRDFVSVEKTDFAQQQKVLDREAEHKEIFCVSKEKRNASWQASTFSIYHLTT